METIQFFILSHKPQFVFFMVFMTACIPMLVYYRRRHANPRFRPSLGEMTMVTIFAVFLSGGIAAGLGGLFNEKQDFKKFAEKPDNQDNGTVSILETKGSTNKADKPDKKADNSAALMGILSESK